jgi:hypothetical protein
LAEVLADVLESERRIWQRERALIEAQAQSTIATLQAAVANLRSDNSEQINARLSLLKDGADGRPGDQGIPGVAGEPGPKGDPGRQGDHGERGEPGLQGLQGERGEKGLDGAPGKLLAVKAWAEGVHYEGDVVTHAGGLFQAQRDSAREPYQNQSIHADWICLAAPGKDAAQLTIRGTYSEMVADYRYLDIVMTGGSSFIACTDKPGPCPGPGWQLIVSAGRAGKPGLKGDRGDAGPPGKAGERGEAAPVIVDWKYDFAQFRATPVMSDGSQVPPLELRGMFEQFHIEAR